MKAPALVKRLTVQLIDMGYTQEEAHDMISNEGTASIASFIQSELEYKHNNEQTVTVTATKSEEKNMALVMSYDVKGKLIKSEHVDYGSGTGVEAARPLPKVAKAEPTKVEQTPATATVNIQSEPTPQKQAAELMYDFKKLPVALQEAVEHTITYRTPHDLPVCQVVGFSGEGGDYRPILKVLRGQATINAYGWLMLTDAREWQNLPMLVVMPTDAENLRKARAYYSRPDAKELHTFFSLTCISVVRKLVTFDFSTAQVVVPAPAVEKVESTKVKARATKQEKQDVVVELAKPKQAPAITDEALAELTTTTNLMSLRAKTNRISEALGLTKLDTRTKKADVQARVLQIQALLNVPTSAPEPTPAQEVAPAPAKETKAKAAKAAKVKAPTKAAIEEFYIADLMRETSCTKAQAKTKFKALDIRWVSSIERTEFAQSLGMTLETA